MTNIKQFAGRSFLSFSVFMLAACSGEAPLQSNAATDPEQTDVHTLRAALNECAANITVDPFKELTIVHPSVVDGPDAANNTGTNGGALSFNRIMSQLAGSEFAAPDFTERFLKNWLSEHQVGRGNVEARSRISDLLDPSTGRWPRRFDGQLDMTKAPFRLLAIANRLDLMRPGKPNGEARLVFGLFDPINRSTNEPFPSPAEATGESFTIIFEFNLPTTRTPAQWAELWHALGSKQFGPEYNAELIKVIRLFTERHNISQVRTNEFFLGSPWQLREFALGQLTLVPSTTQNSPEQSLNNSQELIDWVKANQAAILNNTHRVPETLLGGKADQGFPCFGRGCIPNFNGTKWDLSGTSTNPSGISEELRSAFARETCNGCHNSDPGPGGVLEFFYHVAPSRPAGLDGTIRLSGFVKEHEIPKRTEFLKSLLPCPLERCTAKYEIGSSWPGSSQANVTITNNGTTPVSTWNVALAYDSGVSVTSFWNAVSVDNTAPDYKFKDAGWNASIPPGATRTFGVQTNSQTALPISGSLIAHCE